MMQMRLSAWLLQLAYRFRRWTVDRALARHVLACKGRFASGRGKCTQDLDNCDENQFCKIGKALFIESFDLTFKINLYNDVQLARSFLK